MSAFTQLSSSLDLWNASPDIDAFDSPFPGNVATGGMKQQIGGSESPSDQSYFPWPRSVRKPPKREGDGSQFLAHSSDLFHASLRQLSAEMDAVKAEYVLRNEPAIAAFFSTHRTAAHFLLNAAGELKKSFGDDVVLNLEALVEDNDSSTLYAIAVWRGPAELADEALEDFDERGWLNRPPHPGITLTYELA